jgi:hypothetical protein
VSASTSFDEDFVIILIKNCSEIGVFQAYRHKFATKRYKENHNRARQSNRKQARSDEPATM